MRSTPFFSQTKSQNCDRKETKMLNTEKMLNKIVNRVANAERFWLTAFAIMFLLTWFLGI